MTFLEPMGRGHREQTCTAGSRERVANRNSPPLVRDARPFFHNEGVGWGNLLGPLTYLKGLTMSARKRAIAKSRIIQPSPGLPVGSSLPLNGWNPTVQPNTFDVNIPIKFDTPGAVNLAQQLLQASGWKGTLTVR